MARNATSFARAFGTFRRSPSRAVRDDALMRRLVHAWDNEGWSVQIAYLRRLVECLYERPGAMVLECGSGLSTLVLGATAEHTKAQVYSLEHHAEWRSRTLSALALANIRTVALTYAPLDDHGAFDWYRPDRAVLAQRYDVVVCDGPPGDTRGGRYGLMPVMQPTLAGDCVILLDDTSRDAERTILEQWIERFGGAVRMWSDGEAKQFGEYRLGAARDAAAPSPQRWRA